MLSHLAEQRADKLGLDLLVGHCDLPRRHLFYDPHRRRSNRRQLGADVVEQQVTHFASLDCHERERVPMCPPGCTAVHRARPWRGRPNGMRRRRRRIRDSDQGRRSPSSGASPRTVCRSDLDRIDRTCLGTLGASAAQLMVYGRDEVGGNDPVVDVVLLDRPHHPAATPATVAHVGDAVTHVVPGLGKTRRLGQRQNVECFSLVIGSAIP